MKYILLIVLLFTFGCADMPPQPTPPTTPPVVTNPKPPEAGLKMPAYSSNFGVTKKVYEQAVAYYNANQSKLSNKDRVVIIDFSFHSSSQRMVYLDLNKGSFTRYHVSHGEGSDPDGDGKATKFSNISGSKMSSLGAYLTLGTYSGKHGYSMKLRGLESTNSLAEARAIVMHPATYVKEATNSVGRSWGCPAIDHAISKGLIDKIKNGTLLYAGY